MTAPTTTAPARRDRRALLAVAVQFFVNGTAYATIVPRLPDIRDRVGISLGTLGFVLTLGSVAGLVSTLLAGRVIGRFGSRRTMIVGNTFLITALVLIGVATTPWMLVVGLMTWLFVDVFVDVGMNVQGAALSARRHTPVMNRLHGLWSLGTVGGGLVAVAMLRAGVASPVHLMAVAAALLGAVSFVASGLLHEDEAPELDEESASIGRPTPPRRGGSEAIVLAIGGAMAMVIELTNGDWAAFRLGDDLGARPGLAGLGFLAFTAGMTTGRLSGDWMQVRIGTTRLMRLSAIVSGIGTAAAALAPVIALSILGFLVAGLGASVLFPQFYDRAARAPGPPGSGFSSMLIGQRGAAVVAPFVVGTLADSEALGVGAAIAIVVLPCSVTVYAITLVGGRRRAG